MKHKSSKAQDINSRRVSYLGSCSGRRTPHSEWSPDPERDFVSSTGSKRVKLGPVAQARAGAYRGLIRDSDSHWSFGLPLDGESPVSSSLLQSLKALHPASCQGPNPLGPLCERDPLES
jgi:hypothetical protein